MSTLISLKIRNKVFDITEDDLFMDNGACVQLVTRKIRKDTWYTTCPKLSERAIREISVFEHVNRPHSYGKHISVFSLKPKTS